MRKLMKVPAVALAAATVIAAFLSAPVKAADEGRSTVMWLVIDFVPHARPKWGSVTWIWLVPPIQYASFAECRAATQTVNWRYQQRTEAYVSKWPGKPGYNHQVLCYSAKAISDQAITWDICDRAGLGFGYAKACQALTYHKPTIDRRFLASGERLLRMKKLLRY